jgi:hypothetical protein
MPAKLTARPSTHDFRLAPITITTTVAINGGSMARELFPYQADRALIRAFLRGKRLKLDTAGWESNLSIKNGNILAYGGTVNLAWIAQGDGALYAKLLNDAAYHHSVRLIHFLLDELGQPDRRIVREDAPLPEGKHAPIMRNWAYFIDGAPVGIDDPILIVGPLGLAAYRATPERVELDP